MPLCLDLFLTFARVGSLMFGGGYAMLPLLQREVTEKKGWASEEEILDYYAIGQCTPGIIAVNTATFVGYKQRGVRGAVCATLGVVFPSLVIITIIAALLSGFADWPVVKNAFAGIRVCVCVLIINSVIKLLKKSVTDAITAAVFAAVCLGAVLLTGVSPVWFVLGSALLGIVLRVWLRVGKEGSK